MTEQNNYKSEIDKPSATTPKSTANFILLMLSCCIAGFATISFYYEGKLAEMKKQVAAEQAKIASMKEYDIRYFKANAALDRNSMRFITWLNSARARLMIDNPRSVSCAFMNDQVNDLLQERANILDSMAKIKLEF